MHGCLLGDYTVGRVLLSVVLHSVKRSFAGVMMRLYALRGRLGGKGVVLLGKSLVPAVVVIYFKEENNKNSCVSS